MTPPKGGKVEIISVLASWQLRVGSRTYDYSGGMENRAIEKAIEDSIHDEREAVKGLVDAVKNWWKVYNEQDELAGEALFDWSNRAEESEKRMDKALAAYRTATKGE